MGEIDISEARGTAQRIDWRSVGAVVLAAGRGTRLNSTDRPKVMHEIVGRPIVSYIVETLAKLSLPRERVCLVVGFQQEVVKEYFGGSVTYAKQSEQRGTADAAYVGMRALPPECETVLVCGGDDSAFYRPETLCSFVVEHIESGAVLSLLTAEFAKPDELGRVARHSDGQVEVIEKEYLTREQRQIKEVSTGTYCFKRVWFERIFPIMPPLRKLGEYGLPTALTLARQEGAKYRVVKLADSREWFGVNTREELSEAEKRMSGIRNARTVD